MYSEQIEPESTQVAKTIERIDSWLETMRCPGGYGGPVAHWWQNCLQYTGAGLDWRYEGIILGYLNLYKRTGNEKWLSKARRAGDDLVKGQLPTGNFRNSNFELNPYPGGTPHEAACDIGLLALAKKIREKSDPGWETYARVAELNVRTYLIGRLWEPRRNFFRDGAGNNLLVLNKAATILEVLLALAEISGDYSFYEQYGHPTLECIVENQIVAPGTLLDGGIDQSISGNHRTGMFFPFYNARCIPALIQGYQVTGKKKYLQSALSAIAFIQRQQLPDGSFPQLIYKNGRKTYYPRWIAGAGNILLAMDIIQQYNMETSLAPTLQWLLKGFLPSGGCRTAYGFSSQSNQKTPSDLPDFLDVLPVCGWVDKAFCYLSSHISTDLSQEISLSIDTELDCLFHGKPSYYHEDSTVIEVWQEKKLAYRWIKSKEWAETPVLFG